MVENIASSIAVTQRSESPTPKQQWRELGVHNCIKILIIGGLFVYLFHQDIEVIVYKWVNDSAWSHGFLIPLFSLYFLNQYKMQILNLQTKPNYLGLFFLMCGILFYPLNIVHLHYGYLSPIGMIATLGAVVLFLGGWGLIKYTWLPIAYLVFAVPLPERYYVSLTIPMRQWAATAATSLLNLVNDLHLVKDLQATANGVVIDVIYKGHRLDPPLDVAEACSGMRLLTAFLALGVAMAYLHYRPAWQRIVLLLSTIPIGIFCNFVRVTVTGFIYVMLNPKYAQGVYHDMLGMSMLPLAFGLYGLLAWFMSSLFVESGSLSTQAEDVVIRKRKV